MSLANIHGKMSRMDMRNIMAGTGSGAGCSATAYCSNGTTISCTATSASSVCYGTENYYVGSTRYSFVSCQDNNGSNLNQFYC